MEDSFDEPFEIKLVEDNNPDRPHFYVYNGLLDSELFNAHEVILIIHLIAFADNSEPNRINTTTISINKLSQKLGMSKATVCKYIRLLEQKGVLVKKNRVSEDNGYLANIYEILNYTSVWDCITLDELKKETDRIKREIQHDNATDLQQSQELVRFTLQDIKQLFDYDIMIHDCPDEKQNIDFVMDILHTAMNTTKETIKIAGTNKTTMAVTRKLMKLNNESILYAIRKYKEQAERIENANTYMLTMLYNVPEQLDPDITK